MNIEQAALAERSAEQNRAAAEAGWRQSWWETTRALAEPAEGDKTKIGFVLSTAERILGHSRSYLSWRRRLGRCFITLESDEIQKLPPRLALAYLDANGDPAKAVAVLQDAEARDLSLRDFAVELGTQPTSWLREGERRALPTSHEDKVAAAKAALADPKVAETVLADPETSQRARDIIDRRVKPTEDALGRAEEHETRERAQRGDMRYLHAQHLVLVAKGKLLEAITELRYVEDDEDGLSLVREAHDRLKEVSRLVDARLSSTSGTDWDYELQRLS